MITKHYLNINNFSFGKIVVIFALIIIFSVISIHAEMLSVRGDKVNLRTGPGQNFSAICEYDSGFPIEIVEQKGNWLKTKDFEGDTGWMHKSFLTNRKHTIVKANRNKDESINIRKGPGSNHPIIGKAYYGVVFSILKLESGWVEVHHESGLTGWVSTNLLWGY